MSDEALLAFYILCIFGGLPLLYFLMARFAMGEQETGTYDLCGSPILISTASAHLLSVNGDLHTFEITYGAWPFRTRAVVGATQHRWGDFTAIGADGKCPFMYYWKRDIGGKFNRAETDAMNEAKSKKGE